MKIALITDEVTQNFEECLAFAIKHKLSALEFRTMNDMAIHLIDDDTLKYWKLKLDENNIKTCCIAGSFYKCEPLDNLIEEELKKLKRLCEQADILDAKYIRGFAFFSSENKTMSAKEIAPYFEKPIEILKQYNKTLLLEADPSVNTPTHALLAECIKEINSEYVGAIFDPGNSIYAEPPEQPYPTAYEQIKPYMKHIHIKDSIYVKNDTYCVKVGTGEVGYTELLKAVFNDGYSGYFSMETHYRHDVNLSEEQMKTPGGSVFSSGGMQASAESIEALQEIYNQIKK